MTGRLRPYSAIDDLQQKAIDGPSLEACKLAEISDRRLAISRVRFFRRGIRAQVLIPVSDAYASKPPAMLTIRERAFKALNDSAVSAILTLISLPQISYPVVKRVPIPVVYPDGRP